MIGVAFLALSQVHRGAAITRTMQDELVAAAETGEFAKVKQFLAKGADPNGPSPEALKHGARFTPLGMAVSGGKAAVVRVLLKAGADLNRRMFFKNDKVGEAPVFIAIARDRVDCLDVLLKAGAKVNVRNYRGETPLAFAKRLGRTAEVGLLTRRTLKGGGARAEGNGD